jgi:hypothetical protein
MADNDGGRISQLLKGRRAFARDVAVNVFANLVAAAIIYLSGAMIGLFPSDIWATLASAAVIGAAVVVLGFVLARVQERIAKGRRRWAFGLVAFWTLIWGVGMILFGTLFPLGDPGFITWIASGSTLSLFSAWGLITAIREPTPGEWLAGPPEQYPKTPRKPSYVGHMDWYDTSEGRRSPRQRAPTLRSADPSGRRTSSSARRPNIFSLPWPPRRR